VALSGIRKILMITLPFALIAGVLAAAAVEVWVRATWDTRRGRPGFFLTDPVRGQRLAAGYDGWFAGVPVHINSLELRDPREYSFDKRANTFRILVLGDSVTFGHGSVYEHTYPRLLEERLRQWRPDVDWQVWNAAVPGYNTSQELAQLLEVGARFQPDLVVVGFFWNDLYDNQPATRPGWVRTAGAQTLSFARRHFYSFEFYKRAYLTARWRLSGQKDDRLRAEHADGEQQLLAATDLSGAPEQRLTSYEHLTDERVAALRCVDGMTFSPESIRNIERDPGYAAWRRAVRDLQQLNRDGRFRIVFFVNSAPAKCRTGLDGEFFYDGGTRSVDQYYLKILGEGTPAVSSFERFMHTRPDQMPDADEHSIGNSNAVKADVLFEFLQQRILPEQLSAARDASR